MISKEEYNNYVNSILSQEDKEKMGSFNNGSNKLKTLSNVFLALFVICLVISLVLIVVMFTSFNRTHTPSNFNYSTYIFICMFLSVVFIVVYIAMRAKINSVFINIENNYKEQIINFLLKDKNFSYNKTYFINYETFRNAQICNSLIDEYSWEDFLSINIPKDDGTKSNINFYISDIKAVRIDRDEEKDTFTRTTVYSGAFGFIDFPFTFKATLTINSSYRSTKSLEKVKLEDIKFNKAFKVKCSDQIEARYILTPELMLDLLKLKQKMGQILLVLDGSRMYIAFPHKNLFKINRNTKKIGFETFYTFYEDIYSLLSLVKEIQTNNKIFKM